MGNHAGDLYIKAFSNDPTISSEIYLCDANWYRGASVDGLHIDNGVSCTSDGTWITITKSSSGEKYVVTPYAIGQNDDFEWSYIINWTNTVNQITWGFYNSFSSPSESNKYISLNKITGVMSCYMDSTKTYSGTWADGDKITIKKQGTSLKVYQNGTEIISNTYAQSGTKYIGFYTNNGRKQVFKELILKPL